MSEQPTLIFDAVGYFCAQCGGRQIKLCEHWQALFERAHAAINAAVSPAPAPNETGLRAALAKIPRSVWNLYLNEQDKQVFDTWWLAAASGAAGHGDPFPYNDHGTMEACAERIICEWLGCKLHEGDVKYLLDEISSGQRKPAQPPAAPASEPAPCICPPELGEKTLRDCPQHVAEPAGEQGPLAHFFRDRFDADWTPELENELLGIIAHKRIAARAVPSDALREFSKAVQNETSSAWRVGVSKAKRYLGADELKNEADKLALSLHHADQVDSAIERALAAAPSNPALAELKELNEKVDKLKANDFPTGLHEASREFELASAAYVRSQLAALAPEASGKEEVRTSRARGSSLPDRVPRSPRNRPQ